MVVLFTYIVTAIKILNILNRRARLALAHPLDCAKGQRARLAVLPMI